MPAVGFYVREGQYVYMSARTLGIQKRSTGVRGWDRNLGLLEEQKACSTSEPCFQLCFFSETGPHSVAQISFNFMFLFILKTLQAG